MDIGEGIVMDNMPETGTERAIDYKFPCSIDVSTQSFPRDNQFEIFRNAHVGVADLTFCKSADGSFPARLKVWMLGSMLVVSTVLPGKGYAHEWRHVKKAALDNWYLCLPVQALERASGGQTLPHLRCLAKPFEVMVEDEGALSVFLPSDGFVATSTLESLLHRKMEGALGHLLADYLVLLARSLADLTVAEVPYVVEATRNLIIACLAPSQDRVVDAQTPIGAVVLERAKRLINTRLADHSLTAETICSELGVSRSRLYRLFEPLGGVAAYIRHERLVRTRAGITNSNDVRAIFHIAEEWGFDDPSAYSRAFRHEFGMTPKEAREVGWVRDVFHVQREKNLRHGGPLTLCQALRGVA
ncbi:helix-turn-helix domain-containing protein [Rhizobium mongolense]|uniref:helix-turn-helix domain-containing protein n=1 Tax=Rhizobium mongolense TaxID=57676 RepID=UPI0034A39CD8